jgi:asparagine synthase (glutamine-hydrolysing)
VQAARIARHFGFPFERLLVEFPDFLAAIPCYLATAGHPTGLGSVGTRLLCESMGAGFAAVTGEGADDVFGGYGDYLQSMKDRRETMRRAELVAEHGFELSAEAADLLRRNTVNHTFPTYLAAVHTGQELGPYTQRDAQLTHLTGAATGTRLRLPYLDHRLVELALALPVEYRVDHQVGIDKRVLRTAVLRHFAGHDVLVDSVLRRKFGGPSAVRGHKERFAMVCERYLPPGYRDGHPLGPLAQHTHELVLLELFEEIFVTRRGVLPTGFGLAEFLRERSRGLRPVPS